MKIPKVNFRSLFDQCLLCQQSYKGLDQTPSGICAGCLDDLPILTQKCSHCSLPLSTSNDLICGECSTKPPSYDHVDSFFLYRFPIDHLIGQVKYSQKVQYIGLIASLMHHFANISPSVEALIPIPMYRLNQFKRGFNQAELIARGLSRHTHIPVDTQLLTKLHATHPQMGLSRLERLKNQKGSFACTPSEYHHVMLIDDVMTTGATLETVSQVLKQNGVARVSALTLARTER